MINSQLSVPELPQPRRALLSQTPQLFCAHPRAAALGVREPFFAVPSRRIKGSVLSPGGFTHAFIGAHAVQTFPSIPRSAFAELSRTVSPPQDEKTQRCADGDSNGTDRPREAATATGGYGSVGLWGGGGCEVVGSAGTAGAVGGCWGLWGRPHDGTSHSPIGRSIHHSVPLWGGPFLPRLPSDPEGVKRPRSGGRGAVKGAGP